MIRNTLEASWELCGIPFQTLPKDYEPSNSYFLFNSPRIGTCVQRAGLRTFLFCSQTAHTHGGGLLRVAEPVSRVRYKEGTKEEPQKVQKSENTQNSICRATKQQPNNWREVHPDKLAHTCQELLWTQQSWYARTEGQNWTGPGTEGCSRMWQPSLLHCTIACSTGVKRSRREGSPTSMDSQKTAGQSGISECQSYALTSAGR